MDDRELARAERIFDDWAPTYESNPWYVEQNEILLRELPAKLSGTVLDVGCGTGRLLRRITKLHADVRGVGIDLSTRMIEVARREASRDGANDLVFHRAEWERTNPAADPLNLSPGSVDDVVCVSAFHYFVDPLEALRKMRRLLRPGGRLLLLDRDVEGSPATRVWNLVHRYWIKDHVRFYSATRLREMLDESGFVEVEVRARIHKLFWKGKAVTGLVLLSASAEERGAGAATA